MKNIKLVKLDKYKPDNYNEISYGIYLNKSANNYCFCFEADVVDQYPLEDLLDQYGVNCTEYYGQGTIIDGEKKNIVEVETLSSNKIDLIKILNFSTIVDKEIINVAYNGSELLVINYGESNIIINEKEIHIPIVGYRNDRSGMVCFELKYPEAQYKKQFTDGHSISIDIDNFNENNFKYILLKDSKATIIYENNNKTTEIIFNLKELEQIK